MELYIFNSRASLMQRDDWRTFDNLYRHFEKIGVYAIWDSDLFEGACSIDVDTTNINDVTKFRKELRKVFIEKIAYSVWNILNRYVKIDFNACEREGNYFFNKYYYFVTTEDDYNNMVNK